MKTHIQKIVTSWVKYLASSSSLDRIHSAPCISDLWALSVASDRECDREGKKVIVCGQGILTGRNHEKAGTS
ncbi:hypothetical protein M5K25_026465 [Dendrobium thyrsiflorum]|uniref:Uncharacterized protein n=1 Tax=Dendrobium thyrsiflorum TaxID=117978 RepID=A0ABD0TXS9_DENTH